MAPSLPSCQCPACQGPEDSVDRQHHQRLLLVFTRLDEAQRRWFAALEADRAGPDGDRLLFQITGLAPKTIQRGRQELAQGLEDHPAGHIRRAGSGRPRIEKKPRPS